jgi:ATP-dependent RNA helicase DDX24/MAK5
MMAQKRERQPNSAKSRKRRRLSQTDNATTASDDGVFDADHLDWKAVQLPDRLDDAEGFFGLEEIEGVDILRSDAHGGVKFKVCKIILDIQRRSLSDVCFLRLGLQKQA